MNEEPDSYIWTDGNTYTEMCKQEYGGNNCKISAGLVDGPNRPDVDTVYLRLEKDGEEPTVLLLRPDEMQAIVWVTSGTIWSHLYQILEATPDDDGG